MFTFIGDTVLDPFLGSGTTVKAALELGRNALGYEINADFGDLIGEKMGLKEAQPLSTEIQIMKRERAISKTQVQKYKPRIQDSQLLSSRANVSRKSLDLHKVAAIQDERTLVLDDGRAVTFLGIQIDQKEETERYLIEFLLGKTVLVKDAREIGVNGLLAAYVYLKNKLFINTYLIKSGLASPDIQVEHRLAQKFRRLFREAKEYR